MNPLSLEPDQEKDFATLKTLVLLMGLPLPQIAEFMSKLWGQFIQIQRLNQNVASTLSFLISFYLN